MIYTKSGGRGLWDADTLHPLLLGPHGPGLARGHGKVQGSPEP